jgi:hypothetical protein
VTDLGGKELNLLRLAYYPQLDIRLEGYFQAEAKLKVNWDTVQQGKLIELQQSQRAVIEVMFGCLIGYFL